MNILKACTGIMWLGQVRHPERLKMFSAAQIVHCIVYM